MHLTTNAAAFSLQPIDSNSEQVCAHLHSLVTTSAAKNGVSCICIAAFDTVRFDLAMAHSIPQQSIPPQNQASTQSFKKQRWSIKESDNMIHQFLVHSC